LKKHTPGGARGVGLRAPARPWEKLKMEVLRAEWLDSEEQTAWRGFLTTYSKLTAVLGRDLAQDSGLSIQDYGVLVALSEAKGGRLRPFELGKELVWEKSRLSHHISRMTQRGLVSRVKCDTDNRGAFVEITAVGRKVIKSAAPGHVAAVRKYFVDVLSRKEIEALISITEKVNGVLPQSQCDEECASQTK
jgi:DNA-binding MarR family transcriptional regulator